MEEILRNANTEQELQRLLNGNIKENFDKVKELLDQRNSISMN